MRLLPAALTALGLSLCVAAAQSDENPAQPLIECGGAASLSLMPGVKPGIYQGMLAGKRISLQVIGKRATQERYDPTDRYTYDQHGIDIQLNRGRTRGGALLLAEFTADYPALNARGCFELRPGAGGLVGKWYTPDKARTYPLTLSPVNVAAMPLALPSTPGLLALRRSDPFIFLKLNRPWKTVKGGVIEPLSRVSYPRGAGAALNAALQDRQLSLAADALDCSAGAFASFGDADPQGNTTVGTATFRSAHLLSIREGYEADCGGAHPDSGTVGRTLDQQTGQLLILSGTPDSLWAKLTPTMLLKVYLAGYPKDQDPECRAAVSDEVPNEQRFRAVPDPPGPDARRPMAILPHVVAACGEEVTVPYSALRRYADAGSAVLQRPVPLKRAAVGRLGRLQRLCRSGLRRADLGHARPRTRPPDALARAGIKTRRQRLARARRRFSPVFRLAGAGAVPRAFRSSRRSATRRPASGCTPFRGEVC